MSLGPGAQVEQHVCILNISDDLLFHAMQPIEQQRQPQASPYRSTYLKGKQAKANSRQRAQSFAYDAGAPRDCLRGMTLGQLRYFRNHHPTRRALVWRRAGCSSFAFAHPCVSLIHWTRQHTQHLCCRRYWQRPSLKHTLPTNYSSRCHPCSLADF
jgi:hypothetical protein